MIISRQVETRTPDETRALGRELAAGLRPGDVIGLDGELGAGKTVLVQGIAEGRGITSNVTSPTFTLIHEYNGPTGRLYHADLYRLVSIQDAMDIGIEEIMSGNGVTVIEWSDKIEPLLPCRAIRVHLTVLDETRRSITIRAP